MRIKSGIYYFCNNLIFLFQFSKKIKKYKNIKEGQSCFIIGNGPSLNKDDLEKIEKLGITTFAANRIYNIYEKTKWRPTYYCVGDDGFCLSDELIDNSRDIGANMMFSYSKYIMRHRKLKCKCIAIYAKCSRKFLENPQFSLNLEKCVYSIATVTYFMIQLAAYMGFKKIYLVGMDNKYAYTRLKDGTIIKNDGQKSYFSGNDSQVSNNPVSTWEMDAAYEYAEKFSREHGFRIYNATRGGYLEKFERVDLDKILE